MDGGMIDGDRVIFAIGDRPITAALWMSFLEGQRAQMLAEGGGELLIRFFDDEQETIAIGYPYPGVPLCGMSHLPDARMVLSIHLAPDVGADGVFTSIAAFPSGSGIVVSGSNTGPLTLVDHGFDYLALMRLVMTRIACGRPIPAEASPTPADWLLCTAADDVVRALDAGGGVLTAEGADGALRGGLTAGILALRRAADPSGLRTVEADWPSLFDAVPFVGNLAWQTLDGERFAVAKGVDAGKGKWWTAFGIANVELLNTPTIEDSLARLALESPSTAAGIRESLEAYAERLDQSRGPDNGGWHIDDPERIVRLIRKTLADSDFRFGIVLLGYRRDGMVLRQSVRIDSVADDSGSHSLDMTELDSIGDSDGVVVIVNSGAQWEGSVLNRANEHGAFTSESGFRSTPLAEGELLARLRRLLTGHAGVEPICTPHDWFCRRILYGLARTLETGHVDGEESEASAEESEMGTEKPDFADVDSPVSLLIDAMLTLVLIRHFEVFAEALGPRRQLIALKDEQPDPEFRFEEFTHLLELLRSLRWSQFDPVTLAKAWGVPAEDARWWRADGLAYQQNFRIPEVTESVMRCLFVFMRSPGFATAADHLVDRIKQLFGEDVPVLWGLLPRA